MKALHLVVQDVEVAPESWLRSMQVLTALHESPLELEEHLYEQVPRDVNTQKLFLMQSALEVAAVHFLASSALAVTKLATRTVTTGSSRSSAPRVSFGISFWREFFFRDNFHNNTQYGDEKNQTLTCRYMKSDLRLRLVYYANEAATCTV